MAGEKDNLTALLASSSSSSTPPPPLLLLLLYSPIFIFIFIFILILILILILIRRQIIVSLPRPHNKMRSHHLTTTTLSLLLLSHPNKASGQTWSRCNPLISSQCPPNTALSMAINVDFRHGAVNSFVPSGSPTYDDQQGVSFTVARGGEAPQLTSVFYIMYGRVEITMKAAPGPGIVSSLVLESDVLDEIDIEWLGSNPNETQTNYFGKGKTTTYNRGRFHTLVGTQSRFITYVVDWTAERIIWQADATQLRVLTRRDAEPDQYPQTPMRVKFGAWAGGDPAFNPPGTVAWARGPTDYGKGPFSMLVQSVSVTDYSTGKEYRYKDQSGSDSSIEAVGGAVNANANRNTLAISPNAAASRAGGPDSVPVGGLARDGSQATRSQAGWPWVPGAVPTGGPIPSGWHMTPEGKIMRDAASAAHRLASALPMLLLLLPLVPPRPPCPPPPLMNLGLLPIRSYTVHHQLPESREFTQL
ncbi:hypothetical protein L249_7040 [Ophiocordyceps polyrhachis-furcata BCC 54312]|uniref:GH16 domain-containing protein n=1 Tax=Ophiocordyceps polyrhachis-furcata BCC 54312 TaxID=1330021 RepID=A0A367LKB9_9HYPO|nr:hypothetical protein L249_7040 [Ophiocordyceps polyrhachis-furcata BCC 54312]